MSKELIKQRILKEKPKLEKEFGLLKLAVPQDDESGVNVAKNFLQEDPNIFLLNNLLLTIQFFENYERDVEILRENWFKEFSLESHHKKCFYADSLFRESGAKVKFSTFHGINKNSNDFLHPLRIYISSDNTEAAFDPTNLGRVKKDVWPQYLFQVKMDEYDEKQGSASLILFKTLERPKNRFDATTSINKNLNNSYKQEKFNDDTKEKKIAITDKFSTSYNKELNFKMQDERISQIFFKEKQDDVIPPSSFYYFATPEESLNSVSLVEYRMNMTLKSSHEIPLQCFQKELMKTALAIQKRNPEEKFYRTRTVLNSAAFKGHFCDLLIQKLAKPLDFDINDLQAGIIQEEFAIFGGKNKNYISHVIEILDWNRFISLTEHRYNAKSATEVAWPTNQMWEIMNSLPCYVVPDGVSDLTRKSPDHEKKWKIVFLKTEQFLLLHMMHSQIRCYLFILCIYKSFIEPEINVASLGPKHLLHLFFWQVHKNFLAWPEEQPAETLLSYFEILYKKLQNKFLRDFFINSRNLFATSFAKDMHKAQALIKKILQNPVPYVLQAIRNLELDSTFYPVFNAVKVSEILSPISIRTKRIESEKKGKKIYIEDMEGRLWTKRFKQVQSVIKAEEPETIRNTTSAIDTENIVNFDFRDSQKFNQILQIFILHYVEMGGISIKFKFVTQAFMYLFRIQSLFELISDENLNKEDLKVMKQKINNLKVKCDELKREGKLNQTMRFGKTKLLVNPTAIKLKSQQQVTENDTSAKKIYEKNDQKIVVLKKSNYSDNLTDERSVGNYNEEWETKL